MTIRTSFSLLLLLLLLIFQSSLSLISSKTGYASLLNSSNLLFLSNPDSDNNPRPQQQQQQQQQHFPHFLEDVLKKISVTQRWKLDEIKVTNLDLRKARVGRSKRYEVRLRVGKSDLIFGVSDDVVSWKKVKNGGRGGGGDFGALVNGVRSMSVLDSFKIDGPFELRVDAEEELSLLLPMNTTHSGLRRVLVGEGITVEVKGAQDVSLICSSDLDLPLNRSFVLKKKTSEIWPFGHSSCAPLLPIHISGSSSLVAYKTRNPDAYIETTFLSKEIIELLPEKCYNRHLSRKWACPIDTLSLKIALLEKLLRSFLGGRYRQNGLLGSVKAKIKALAVVRFQLELERHIVGNENLQGTLAEWRTRPTVERNWFEIIARVEAEMLKPLLVKKVRPFIAKDTIAWSNLMSNISFTKFPSLLVPPEALTLDIKW